MPVGVEAIQEARWLLSKLLPTDIIVVDGYHFGPDYARTFWHQQQPVVCLDDLGNDFLWADMVVNQAGGMSSGMYTGKTLPGTTLLLGPSYALLRPSFQRATQVPNRQPNIHRIFLNMGGADPGNHTGQLIKQIRQQFPYKALEVVTGAAYPHQGELEEQVSSLDHITLHHNLDAEQLTSVLQRCGIHICPPSGMAYECCAVGSLLFLHPIADNQHYLLSFLTEAGLALSFQQLTTIAEADLPTLAQQTIRHQRQVFDGTAGPRFKQAFTDLHAAYQLTLRRAQPTDAQQYFTWANDPDVRRNAIHPEPIEWASHLSWFSRRLAAVDSFLFIFERDQTRVGQVRIDFLGSEGLIDYSIDAAFRGQGLGIAVLRRALSQLRRDKPGSWSVTGQVKAGNLPSCRVFQRLGFTQTAAIQLREEVYEVFRLESAAVVS